MFTLSTKHRRDDSDCVQRSCAKSTCLYIPKVPLKPNWIVQVPSQYLRHFLKFLLPTPLVINSFVSLVVVVIVVCVIYFIIFIQRGNGKFSFTKKSFITSVAILHTLTFTCFTEQQTNLQSNTWIYKQFVYLQGFHAYCPKCKFSL